jgi:hypothetical protein
MGVRKRWDTTNLKHKFSKRRTDFSRPLSSRPEARSIGTNYGNRRACGSTRSPVDATRAANVTYAGTNAIHLSVLDTPAVDPVLARPSNHGKVDPAAYTPLGRAALRVKER